MKFASGFRVLNFSILWNMQYSCIRDFTNERDFIGEAGCFGLRCGVEQGIEEQVASTWERRGFHQEGCYILTKIFLLRRLFVCRA